MNRDVELERILDDWFAVGANKAPAVAVERALAQVAATPRATPLATRWGLGPIAGLLRTPAARLTAILLLLLATMLAMLAGGAGQRSTITFVSPRYGYQVDIPADWSVTPAAAAWRVAEAWDAAPGADVLSRDVLRFTAVSSTIVGTPSLQRWATVFVPDRPELREPHGHTHCVDGGSGSPAIALPAYKGWEAATVAGVSAVIRVACGYIDAVTFVGRQAYVLSMFTGRQAFADLTAFDTVVRTIRFDPPRPTQASPKTQPTTQPTMSPEPFSETFASSLYGYRIAHQPSWRITPALHGWDTSGPIFDPETTDTFATPSALKITATDLPASMSLGEWLTTHPIPQPLALQGQADGSQFCRFGGSMYPGSAGRWNEGSVAGWPAWIRATCSTIDAVAGVGGRVFVIRLDTGKRPSADGEAFRAIVDGIVFEDIGDASPPPLNDASLVDIVSPVHGYSARLPWQWTRSEGDGQAPTAVPVQGDPSDTAFDRFDDGPHRTIWAASLPMEAGVSLDSWTAGVPSRQQPGVEGPTCEAPGGNRLRVPPETWRATTVDGTRALERASCFMVDVVVATGGRLYAFSAETLYAATVMPEVRTDFDDFLATVRLTPETAVDAPPTPAAPDSPSDVGQTFSSRRYAYTISYPSTWRTIPATTDWHGSGTWTAAPSADILKPVGRDLPFVSVVAMDLPEAASIDEVIAQALPQRPEVRIEPDGHRHCAFRTPGGGTMFVEGLGATEWYPITIDERVVQMRDSCGHVDVLFAAGRRLYVISFGVGRDSTAHPDRGLFAQMVGSIAIRPDEPLGSGDGS